MSSPTAPLGWVPQNEGGDEVGGSQHHELFTFPFDTKPVSQSDSRASSFSTFHVDDPEPDSDVEDDPPHPDHIPRPPNSFMLYRKQVCKDFARVGPRNRRSNRTGPAPVPGHISKRAGVMWKALKAEERKVWDDLAKWHKEEHARRYPGYVYKPARRGSASSRRRRPHHSASSSQVTLTLTSRGGTPVPDSPISSEVSSSSAFPSLQAQTLPSRRKLHRRSLSVPVYPHHLPTVVDDHEEPPNQFSERTLRRRSRSMTGLYSNSDYSYPGAFSTFMNLEQAYINYPADPSSSLSPYNEYTQSSNSNCATPPVEYHASPLATVASNLSLSRTSSLAGWNGESVPAPRPHAEAYTPLSSDTQTAETFYDPSAYPAQQPFLPNSVPDVLWNPQPPPVYGSEPQPPPDAHGYGAEFYSSMEAMDANANALQQYAIGLSEQGPGPATYLPFGIYHET